MMTRVDVALMPTAGSLVLHLVVFAHRDQEGPFGLTELRGVGAFAVFDNQVHQARGRGLGTRVLAEKSGRLTSNAWPRDAFGTAGSHFLFRLRVGVAAGAWGGRRFAASAWAPEDATETAAA